MASEPKKRKPEENPAKFKFETPDDISDLTLIVEKRKLYVHKTVLCLTSPVFHQMFSGYFKEGRAREVSLPGKKYQAFVNFLHQIYPGQTAAIEGKIPSRTAQKVHLSHTECAFPPQKYFHNFLQN
jgi:hypothetical protein